MAKEKELKIAKVMFVEQGKTAKEIGRLLNVSEQTLSRWVNKYGWADQRNARLSAPKIRTENIKQLINDLSEQRLKLGRELIDAEKALDHDRCSQLRASIAKVDDGVSKWNKTLETINKESRVSLSTYLAVMEMIFDALRSFDEKLFLQLLDFQEVHLNEVSLKFK
ncbi:transposase [Carboxylicivirga linearis]|uniref:Helix-turn-helix domain-containing protein n=1 Tax=Carboxylicivirga linearis TaxID=1628157 RepID=A0ABS5K0N8_9BACT|nr:helix-turn-helix domain-containing protein [Carboxylicivirga linearis]MBS2100702.1 helix-turn-helix domain-containing protein [Carboxylicivirga linearis]